MKKKPIYNDVLLVYLYEETKDTKYLSALTESGWKLVTEIPPRNLIHIFTNYIDIPKKYFKKIWLRYTSNPTTYHPINREYMKTISFIIKFFKLCRFLPIWRCRSFRNKKESICIYNEKEG